MGTDAWINWRGFNDRSEELENFDAEINSDVAFVGGPVTHGPYQLSTVIRSPGEMGLAVLLSAGIHQNLAPDLVVDGKLAAADSKSYHGGMMGDEIAALMSLTLGVRCRVAGTRRLSGFHDPEDVDRSPIYFDVPRLTRPGVAGPELIPRATGRRADLRDLGRLASLPELDEKGEVELVRAARAYSAGLWWANEDPNYAWLLLVTAIEVAASHRQTAKSEPLALLAELWPECWHALKPADDGVRNQVAQLLAPQVRATRKFIDFIDECKPAPPDSRPKWQRLNWEAMRDHAQKVYRHRSKALHSGKPFPLPMLEWPRADDLGVLEEVPGGLTSGGMGAIWDAAETPMLLATFEYIARGALLQWWDEMAERVGARSW